MPKTPAAIVDFWFGQYTDDARMASQQAALWWSKSATVDADIKQRFESSVLGPAHYMPGRKPQWADWR